MSRVALRIALVVPGFSSDEQDWCIPALLDYVRSLAQTADVHVFTLRWPERRDTYPVYGAVVHSLGGRGHLGLRALGLWAEALRAIAAEHRRRPFNVVHAFWADEPGWVAAAAGARLGIPTLISLAGGELVGLRDIGYGLQLLPGRGILVAWCLRKAKLITAGSRYLLDLAHNALRPSERAKLALAPLGVDVNRFSPLPANTGGRAGSGAVLNVGSMHPVKGQRTVIESVAQVPSARLSIAGSGPLRPDLEAAALTMGAAHRVRFLGEVRHDTLPPVYRSAEVLVQGSRHEAQGMAVLEAAACGLPVVGTPVGVLPELGLAAGSAAEMSAQIGTLFDNGALMARLGRAAREKACEYFALGVTVRRFSELYGGLS